MYIYIYIYIIYMYVINCSTIYIYNYSTIYMYNSGFQVYHVLGSSTQCTGCAARLPHGVPRLCAGARMLRY